MNRLSDRSSILLVSTNKIRMPYGILILLGRLVENRTPKGLCVEKQSGGLFFRAKKDCGYRKHEAKRSALGRNLSVKPDGLTILRVGIVLIYFKSNI